MKVLFIGLGSVGQRHLRNLLSLNYNLEIAKYMKLLNANKGLEFLTKFDYKNEYIYQNLNDK